MAAKPKAKEKAKTKAKAKAAPKKNQGGRPRKAVDYDRLDKMCAMHCTGEECAALLEMSYEHLNNQLMKDKGVGFLDYFAEKSASGKASLRRRQYKAAVEDGHPAMMIWMGKQWLGQREPESTKSAYAPVSFDYDKTATPAEQAQQIIDAVSNGLLPADLAGSMIQAITAAVKIEEITVIAEKVAELENLMVTGDAKRPV